MAHHESVLLSLLGSSDPSDRAFAVDLVQQIREVGEQVWPAKSQGVRPVRTPTIQFGANCLHSLADLSLDDTEPPLTKSLTDLELEAIKEKPSFVDLPKNTVAVERGVKETTAAALKSADPVQRDGLSFQISDSRKKNALKVTKKKEWNI